MRNIDSHDKYQFSQGVALVVVLWALVLLSAMSISFIAYVRNEIKLTHNTHDTVRADFLAEAGVYRGIATMLHSDPKQRWPIDGTIQRFELSEGGVAVAVLAESAKIDVNYASADLLDGLFSTLNLSLEDRQSLVGAVLDWRDTDSLRNELGAEDAEYFRQGLSYGAKDGPLASIDELRLVLGMTQEVFNAVKNVLTVYSGSPSVNVELAPLPVLAAMHRGDVSAAQRQLAQRDTSNNKTAAGNSYSSTIYSISSVAETVAGSRSGIVATVSINPGNGSGYKILNWEPITEICRAGMGNFACYDQ